MEELKEALKQGTKNEKFPVEITGILKFVSKQEANFIKENFGSFKITCM
jgi:hypothetical protein